MTRTQRDQELAAAAIPEDPEALRAQIRRTRAELGDTVEALAARADLRARLKERWAAASARARRRTSQVVGTVRSRAAGLAARWRGRSG
jgi:uncharacterized protein YukE